MCFKSNIRLWISGDGSVPLQTCREARGQTSLLKSRYIYIYYQSWRLTPGSPLLGPPPSLQAWRRRLFGNLQGRRRRRRRRRPPLT